MSQKSRNPLRRLLNPIEALGVYLVCAFAMTFNIETTSKYAAKLARRLHHLLGENKTARQNLEHAYPDNSAEENTRIIQGVFENFARSLIEYGQLDKLDIYNDPRIEVRGAQILDRLNDDGKPAVFFSAHLANWEVGIMAVKQRGLPLAQMYRETNNPLVDGVFRYAQERLGGEVLIKGSQGGKRALEILEEGGNVFLLVDQKMNRGLPIPFFGRDAMTAPAAARMARRNDCPFVPVQVERLGGVKFRITIHEPLHVANTDDVTKDLTEALTRMNNAIEGWVRAHPEQWLWMHNRWPKKK